MTRYVLDLEQADRTQVGTVGGKAAHLGELLRMDGVRVPPGVCVTTDAFRRVTEGVPSFADRLAQLAGIDPDGREAIRTGSAEIRALVEEASVPDEVVAAISAAVTELGDDAPLAVRSSATAEDLPDASFAGQQDTFLNVVGPAAVLQHVVRCWGSLFSERAVAYRLRHGFDHRAVHMAVVVQRMLAPQASGVLFTADPLTSNRRVASVEAVPGLGESFVAGHVNADSWKVRDGAIVERAARAQQPPLTDEQVVELVTLGRRIEASFEQPQDIEWCLVDGAFHIVQSRPITTLFPVPEVGDGANHVFISVGHQQMMIDAVPPLGISVRQLTSGRPFHEAGGRLFVDVTSALASPATRDAVVAGLDRADPLIGGALRTVLDRGDFVPEGDAAPPPPGTFPSPPIDPDPALVAALIERTDASVAALERDLDSVSGAAVFDLLSADFPELKRILFDPQSGQVVMAGMEATWWLNEKLQEWLDETNPADTLSLSVSDNVTSAMGLALLDVADAVRPHPEVVRLLAGAAGDEGFLDRLPGAEGGAEAREAIQAFLDRYGMRGIGEIDITRPRWSERPTALLPMILANVRNFEPGEAARRFEHGRRLASAKEQELLERLRALPDGEEKASETAQMIARLRTFIGFREYPKYGMIRRYFLYRRALLREAEGLVRAGVLGDVEDSFFLTFDELRDAVRSQGVDLDLVRRRRDAFRSYQALTPPRVLTSEGEALSGSYGRDDLPDGALAGLPVSAGMVEGRARVVLDVAGADLEPGDILVTTQTDPSWSPLFVAIAGLVTEVGGLMTHGAVIAREYGLPAVVGVQDATRLIRDGERIRVDGTRGTVESIAES